ncbi:MAG: histidine phosphatase family protein [Clostridiales bacterium]|nr:histidine phosphatase family protein [Clostridiales bacterium]
MKLFVARHGQTVWNAQNKVCGITDVELTEKGIEQAKKLADIVKNHNIDILISSPLKRAIETSQIVADKNNIALQIEEALIEQNYGIYEGADRNNDNFLANKRNFAYRYPHGESMMQVAYRIYGLLDKIKEQHQGKNILIITHGGICRIIRTYFIDMSNDDFFNYILENGKLEEYEL